MRGVAVQLFCALEQTVQFYKIVVVFTFGHSHIYAPNVVVSV